MIPNLCEVILQDPGPNTQTAATIRKEVLTPPHTPTPKRGTQVRGGYGGQNPKNHKARQAYIGENATYPPFYYFIYYYLLFYYFVQ